VSDAAGDDHQEHEAELPERRVTLNMLVGYNMTFFRKAAGLTQEELGTRLGWTNVAVSAAERSWDGKRLRKFDADELASIAQALHVPIPALLLPPEDDLGDWRYVVAGDDSATADMRTLLSYAMSDPPDDPSPSMAAYEQRFVAAVRKYFDSRVTEAVATRLKERVLEEELAARLRRARQTWNTLGAVEKALRDVMADNGLLQHFLEAMLAETPEGRTLLGDLAEEEEASGEGQRLPAVLLPGPADTAAART
jgi:transcriptional regulator with XRE-family HTH domain